MTNPTPPQPVVDIAADAKRIAQAVENARQIVEAEFPGYWPRVEACLSVCATLRLKEIYNCIVLILVGVSSSGKGNALDMLSNGVNMYRVDKFTPAAFVANTMGKTVEELEKIDLLTQIKHQVMVTPELSTVLRGSNDQLKELFKVLTNVLDAKGFAPSTATQGRRAIVGDYVFGWLGGSTPIPPRTWDVQAELGSRLLFFDLTRSEPASDDEILAQRRGKPYKQKVETCQDAVRVALVTIFTQRAGSTTSSAIRSVEWGDDPSDVSLWLIRLGRLLAHGRCRKSLFLDDESVPEDPQRNVTLLENIARGRAMLYGRRQLDESDLALIAHIVFSSMPHGKILRAVAACGTQGLSIPEAARRCGFSTPTAKDRMESLVAKNKEIVGIVEWVDPPPTPSVGRPTERVLRFTAPWTWVEELAQRL